MKTSARPLSPSRAGELLPTGFPHKRPSGKLGLAWALPYTLVGGCVADVGETRSASGPTRLIGNSKVVLPAHVTSWYKPPTGAPESAETLGVWGNWPLLLPNSVVHTLAIILYGKTPLFLQFLLQKYIKWCSIKKSRGRVTNLGKKYKIVIGPS